MESKRGTEERLIELAQGNKFTGHPKSMGVYTSDKYTGGFHWFDDRELFLELTKHLAFFHMVQVPLVNDEVFSSTEKILDCYTQGDITLDEAQVEMNKALDPTAAQIEWWGTYEDLCTGDDPFCVEFRSFFRSLKFDLGEDEGTTIKGEEVEAFKQYVDEYEG